MSWRPSSVLRVGGHNIMGAVAEGLADFGITQSTEITPVEGVEIGVGRLLETQLTTVYGVALGAHAAHPEHARAFFDWLASPEGARHRRRRLLPRPEREICASRPVSRVLYGRPLRDAT